MMAYYPEKRPSPKAIAFGLEMMRPPEDKPEPEPDPDPSEEKAFNGLASLNQAMEEAEATGDDDLWVELFMEFLEVQKGL